MLPRLHSQGKPFLSIPSESACMLGKLLGRESKCPRQRAEVVMLRSVAHYTPTNLWPLFDIENGHHHETELIHSQGGETESQLAAVMS